MEKSDMKWINKKVFVKLKNSTRAYSGEVIDENEISITLRDIMGHLVIIHFDEIGLLQEEN